MQTAKQIAAEIHKEVWALFDYQPDKKTYRLEEHWTSHAAAVRAGRRFKDDCDGFALTCAELMFERGINKDKVRAIICETETGERHLVCGVDLEEGTLILDNRYKVPYLYTKKPKYKWLFAMRFSTPGEWKVLGAD